MIHRPTFVLVLASLVACSHASPPPAGEVEQLPAIELDPLPPPIRTVESHERDAPAIDSLDALDAAVKAGHYRASLEALERVSGSAPDRAACIASRLYEELARYDEAIAAAERCARIAAEAERAKTRIAEAHLARGRTNEARTVLESLASSPTAHRARFVLATIHATAGRRQEADALFHGLIRAYNDETIGSGDAEGLMLVARSAAALGAVRDANDAFRESTRADRRRTETQRAWAELFLSKRDYGHAQECLQDALAVNPDEPASLALLARLKMEAEFDFDGARTDADRAVALAPGLVAPHVTLAGMALFDLDFESVARELALARRTNPDDLDASIVEAAMALVRGDDATFDEVRDRVFALAPAHGRFYTRLAIHAEWEHRYPDIVRLAREALRVDPEDAAAHSLLGQNLLYLGIEEEGIAELRAAFRRDRYDVLVFNLLRLFEDEMPGHYEVIDHPPFSIRLPTEDRVVLETAMPRVLTPAYEDMVRRYGFTPEGPIRYELFATPEQFSVRTSGLPNLGVQGVCFGRVITAMAPSAGPVDWGQVDWHEMAHVFHIQISGNRVPRWLTEGLAEYETSVARPEWQRELDAVLVSALDAGSLPSMARMNEAFTHARSGEAMLAAYHAASEIATYLVERFGFPKMVELLRGFRTEIRFEVLAERIFGVSVATLDREFRESYLRSHPTMRIDARLSFDRYRELAPFLARTSGEADARAYAELAAALLVHEDEDAAEQAAERALTKDPNEPLARYVRARIRIGRRDPRAVADLRAIADQPPGSYVARMLLARIAFAREDREGTLDELEAAIALDPTRPDALAARIELGFEDDPEGEVAALERFVAVEEHDAEAFVRYVALLDGSDDHDAIVALAERIERIATRDVPTRLALVRALVMNRRRDDARYHLQIAEALGAEPAELERARSTIDGR